MSKRRDLGKRYQDEWGTIPPFDTDIKGLGFYGLLPRKDGSEDQSSEVSIGVTIDGKNYHVPSLVPGLTEGEVAAVLSGVVTPEIERKAAAWAKDRIGRKMPVYAMPHEEGRFKPLPSKTDVNMFQKFDRYA